MQRLKDRVAIITGGIIGVGRPVTPSRSAMFATPPGRSRTISEYGLPASVGYRRTTWSAKRWSIPSSGKSANPRVRSVAPAAA